MKRLSFVFCLLVCVLFSFGCNKKENAKQETATIETRSLPSAGMDMIKEHLVADKANAIYIHAEWCGVCKEYTPFIKELKEELMETTEITLLNYEDHKELARALRMDGVPQMFLFDSKGNFVKSIKGHLAKDMLKEKLQELE